MPTATPSPGVVSEGAPALGLGRREGDSASARIPARLLERRDRTEVHPDIKPCRPQKEAVNAVLDIVDESSVRRNQEKPALLIHSNVPPRGVHVRVRKSQGNLAAFRSGADTECARLRCSRSCIAATSFPQPEPHCETALSAWVKGTSIGCTRFAVRT